MAQVSAFASITLPCTGPEVMGTVAYITPEQVEWRVMLSGRPGDARTCVDAFVTGRSRNGRRAPGSALYAEDQDWAQAAPPEWLPRPDEWIANASALMLLATEVAIDVR